MSTLHIVSSSPMTTAALNQAFAIAADGDAILLIENGVYGAVAVPDNTRRLQSAAVHPALFVLREDLAARALFTPLADFKVVSYVEFVELVCQHHNSISWS